MSKPPPAGRAWRWPLPALVAWLLGWGCLMWASHGAASVMSPGWALLLAMVPSIVLAPKAAAGWRRWTVLLGLPLMLALLQGLAAVPPWAWGATAAVLLALYPLQAWRDAPLYPTPADALRDLPQAVALHRGARVLDAGSGLGHGLVALRRAYPRAELLGVERSFALRLGSRIRRLEGPWRVQSGDLWALDWAAFDLVYLFQRPETMPRAWRKALEQMRPGAWLVSLEFPVPGHKADIELTTPQGKWLGAYRIPEAGISVPAEPGR